MKTTGLWIAFLLASFSTTGFASVPSEALTYAGCYQTIRLNGHAVPTVKENTGYLKWDASEWTVDVENKKLLPIFEFNFFVKKTNRGFYSQGGRVYFLMAYNEERSFGSRNEQYKFTVQLKLAALDGNFVQAHYIRTMDAPTPEMPNADEIFVLKKVNCKTN